MTHGAIRIPVHFCGVHGLEATVGRINRYGRCAHWLSRVVGAKFVCLGIRLAIEYEN